MEVADFIEKGSLDSSYLVAKGGSPKAYSQCPLWMALMYMEVSEVSD